jgi:hypothetical protein
MGRPAHSVDLRAPGAIADGVPVVYFVATRPGWYEALYPCYVLEDRPSERRVLVAVGRMVGPLDEREPIPIVDSIERQYATREVKVRLHQKRFRWLVIPAYREQCAICRLKEVRLLDVSSATSTRQARRRSRTASACARSTIAPSTRTSSASRPTTKCTWRSGYSATRTGRCSRYSKASRAPRSSSRAATHGDRTASGSLADSSGSSSRSSLARRLGLRGDRSSARGRCPAWEALLWAAARDLSHARPVWAHRPDIPIDPIDRPRVSDLAVAG